MNRPGFAVFALAASMLAAAPISAQYSQTLPEFSGPNISSGFPLDPIAVGTFTGIPGGTIASATISGTFGNLANTSSAPNRLFLGSILVAQCKASDACYESYSPQAWSYTFSPAEFATLSVPSITLTAIQDGEYVIRLGATQLDIRYGVSTVPEPSTVLLLATGLAGVGLVGRARRRHRSTRSLS